MARVRESLEKRLAARLPDAEPDEQAELDAELEDIRTEARTFLGLPANASLEQIQDAFGAEGGMWKFWLFFFPHFRQDDEGKEIPSADFHREFCARIDELVHRTRRQIARAYPREHAKSVFASLVAPVWATANRLRWFPFLFSDTDSQAWEFLADIRMEIETNARLQAIYPEYCSWGEEPRANRLVFGNGTLMRAAGSGKSVRGARRGKRRPDFIILDDIENDEEVENPKRRKKKMTWYHKVVKKLGMAAVYLIVGTVLHAESFLMAQVRSDADLFPALIAEPVNQDLWREWEKILLDRSRKDSAAEARAFYDSRRTLMDAGARVLWAERVPLYQLMVERAEDLASFLSERQNTPFDPSASWFPEDRLLFLEADEMPSIDDVLVSIYFWDPSRGTSKSDTSSAGRMDVLKDGRRVVREAVVERIPPEEVMDVSIGWHKQRPFTVMGVEKVGLSTYETQLRDRALAIGVALPIEPVTPVGDKRLRIKGMRPLVVSQVLQFAASLPLEAKRQVKYFDTYPNDDFPDMVQQMLTLADIYTREVKAAGGTVEPSAADQRTTHEEAFGHGALIEPHSDSVRPAFGSMIGVLGAFQQ